MDPDKVCFKPSRVCRVPSFGSAAGGGASFGSAVGGGGGGGGWPHSSNEMTIKSTTPWKSILVSFQGFM